MERLFHVRFSNKSKTSWSTGVAIVRASSHKMARKYVMRQWWWEDHFIFQHTKEIKSGLKVLHYNFPDEWKGWEDQYIEDEDWEVIRK